MAYFQSPEDNCLEERLAERAEQPQNTSPLKRAWQARIFTLRGSQHDCQHTRLIPQLWPVSSEFYAMEFGKVIRWIDARLYGPSEREGFPPFL